MPNEESIPDQNSAGCSVICFVIGTLILFTLFFVGHPSNSGMFGPDFITITLWFVSLPSLVVLFLTSLVSAVAEYQKNQVRGAICIVLSLILALGFALVARFG